MAMARGHMAMDWDTAPMDMALDTTAMVLVDTMERGLLMLSPRPRLMLIPTTLVDTMVDMAMV